MPKTVKDLQKEVGNWAKDFPGAGGEYWPWHILFLRLVEELGEMSRELNHVFGPKKKKPTEREKELADEFGDTFFALICLSNALDIDLEAALEKTMKKYFDRDKERWANK